MFNCRVYVDISSEKENTFRLIAESYIIQLWSRGGNKTDTESEEFEISEKGVKEAEEWLARTVTNSDFKESL